MEERNMSDSGARLDVAQLVVDYHEPLYRYAYRLSGSVADAEDLTQQVFLVAQQKSDQVRDSQCARAWLFTVLRHCYSKSFRGRLPLVAGDFDVDDIPDKAVERGIDSDELQRAIDALCDEFKIVILMFYFEHRSYREIASDLDVPLGTVMSRLARGKAQLRRSLGQTAPHVPQAHRIVPVQAKAMPAVIRR
jgi:RNA polymerase sigma-70 factor, ECF subfamily